MTCPQWRRENATGIKFCGESGTCLAGVCSSCGAANVPSQKFCAECGARLNHVAASSTSPRPEAYTPKQLAERILISKAALEGERKRGVSAFLTARASAASAATLFSLRGL
jgi:hypothetical protein